MPHAVHDIQDAISLLEKREAREAAHLLEEMVAEMPAYATARVLLARAYEALDDWDLALAVWQEALQIVPNSPVVRRGLERSASRSGSRRRTARAEAEAAASMPGTAAASIGEKSAPTDVDGPATPAEPHAAAPDAGEPYVDDLDAAEPYAAAPDAAESDAEEPDAAESRAEELDAGALHGADPSAAELDPAEWAAAEPDAAEADDEMPDVREPDAEMPDVREPDAGWRDAAEPNAAESHIEKPAATAPDAGEPKDADADAGEPTSPIKAQDVPLPTHLPPRESEAFEEPDPFVDLQDVEDTGNPHYEDLDRLISELESARIVPRPDLESVPSPDLEDDIEDVVSETLARIYASQGQYDEAARVYELLAGQHPEEEDDYLQKASRMRSRASDGM